MHIVLHAVGRRSDEVFIVTDIADPKLKFLVCTSNACLHKKNLLTGNYSISSVTRQSFFPFKTIPEI